MVRACVQLIDLCFEKREKRANKREEDLDGPPHPTPPHQAPQSVRRVCIILWSARHDKLSLHPRQEAELSPDNRSSSLQFNSSPTVQKTLDRSNNFQVLKTKVKRLKICDTGGCRIRDAVSTLQQCSGSRFITEGEWQTAR